MTEQTLHWSRHQALIDQGIVGGSRSTENNQLLAENKDMKALEKELQLVRRSRFVSRLGGGAESISSRACL